MPKAAKRPGLTQALAPYSMKIKALGLLLLLAGGAAAQTPSAKTTQEVGQLFAALKQSNCEFSRNGSWYTAQKASEHLQRKYDYLVRKHLVTTTESFIELAATKSSISGKPYQVRCGKTAPVPSSSWFNSQLNAVRSGGRR